MTRINKPMSPPTPAVTAERPDARPAPSTAPAAEPAPANKGWVPKARAPGVGGGSVAAARTTAAARVGFDPKALTSAKSVDYAARLASAAYLSADAFQQRAKEFGFSESKFFDSSTNQHCTDAQAGVGVVPGVGIFITYRGSESTTDFLRDATAIRSTSSAYGEGQVHKGFQQQTEALFLDISGHVKATMKANPDLPVYFTGHSLGGAVARMAVSRVMTNLDRGDSKGQIGGVYTFGGPAIGDQTFEKNWNQRLAAHGASYIRVRNEEDPVPLLPAINFRHAETGVNDVHLLGPNGAVERTNDLGGSLARRLLHVAEDIVDVNDHLMENYLTATSNWAAASP
jgi:hypothetical protein